MSLAATQAVWSYLRWRSSDPPEGVGDPLPAAAALVLLFLADRHHARDGRCLASEGEIAGLTGLSRSTVNRALRGYHDEWRTRGLLEITFRNGARPSFQWSQTCSENAQVDESDECKPVAETHSACSGNAQVFRKPVAETHTAQDLQDSHGNNKRATCSRADVEAPPKSTKPKRRHPLPATRPNSERLLGIIVAELGKAQGVEPVINGKREKILGQLDEVLIATGDFDATARLYRDKLAAAVGDGYRPAALRSPEKIASADGFNALLAWQPKAGIWTPDKPSDLGWRDGYMDHELAAMSADEIARRDREYAAERSR